MEENPGQPSAPEEPMPPQAPVSPVYAPPQPVPQEPGVPQPPHYAPQQPQYAAPQQPQYAAPQQPPAKKKTWLWVVLAIVALGLLACCGIAAIGGLAYFSASGPAESITALNQAALDRDQEAFERYFDTDSVIRGAYRSFINYVRESPEFEQLVRDVGEDEAERILTEEYDEEYFMEAMAGEFTLDTLEPGEVPFLNPQVTSSQVNGSNAEVVVTAGEPGERMDFVLGMVNEEFKGQMVWRIKEIKNMADLFEE